MRLEEVSKKSRAFVLLEVDIGQEENVMRDLLKFDEVKEVHIITGEKDLIAVLETKHGFVVSGSEKVADFILGKIGRISGVRDTETIIPIRSAIKRPEITKS